jgi:hypothetical protein
MWFGVSLLLRSTRPEESEEEALWEERIIVLQAADEADARQAAEQIGKAEEHEYIAADGSPVRWEFIQVERVCPILSDKVESGTEIFGRFLRASEVQSLLTPFKE